MTTDTKVADLPAKWRAKAKRIRGMTAGSDLVADIMEGSAEDLEAALARQEADKKAAPAEQQGAGNVVIEGLRLADQFFDGQDDYWQWDDGEWFPGSKVREALQAALSPAAQAVDLEQFRESVERIKGHAAYLRDRYAISTQARVSCDDLVAECDRLIALIDQQAGGAE